MHSYNAACGEGYARSEKSLDTTTIQAATGGAPDQIIWDGKIHRFRIENSRDAGWYSARLHNGQPFITCGDWRTRETFKLGGNDTAITAVDRERDQQRQQREQQQRTTKANRTAQLAASIWQAAPPASEHAYLQRKQIPPGQLRQLTPALIQRQAAWFQSWISNHDLHDALLVPMYRQKRIEPPRVLRRLHYLREWSHYEQDEQIFTGSQRACREVGAGGAQGISLAMVGH